MFQIKNISDRSIPKNIKSFIPEMQDIPDEFKNFHDINHKWLKLFDNMFFHGIEIIEVKHKAGIDPITAFRHIKAVLNAFSIQHEHKRAGIAYLLSEWFDNIEYKIKD